MQASETVSDKSWIVLPPSKTRPLTGYFKSSEMITPSLKVVIFLVGAFSMGKGTAK